MLALKVQLGFLRATRSALRRTTNACITMDLRNQIKKYTHDWQQVKQDLNIQEADH